MHFAEKKVLLRLEVKSFRPAMPCAEPVFLFSKERLMPWGNKNCCLDRLRSPYRGTPRTLDAMLGRSMAWVKSNPTETVAANLVSHG